jgi:Cytosine/adenosine deaminases
LLSPAEDEVWMRLALEEARRAAEGGDVPVGAVVVRDGQVIGRGHNRREQDGDPTAHAEILAIRAASETLGAWRLTGSTLYVTIEPCPMCAGALVLARIDRLVYGAADPKAGAAGSLWNIVQDERLNHRLQVTAGVLEDECREIIQSFFRERRVKTS